MALRLRPHIHPIPASVLLSPSGDHGLCSFNVFARRSLMDQSKISNLLVCTGEHWKHAHVDDHLGIKLTQPQPPRETIPPAALQASRLSSWSSTHVLPEPAQLPAGDRLSRPGRCYGDRLLTRPLDPGVCRVSADLIKEAIQKNHQRKRLDTNNKTPLLSKKLFWLSSGVRNCKHA